MARNWWSGQLINKLLKRFVTVSADSVKETPIGLGIVNATMRNDKFTEAIVLQIWSSDLNLCDEIP